MIEADKKSATEGLRSDRFALSFYDTEFWTIRERFYRNGRGEYWHDCVGTDQRSSHNCGICREIMSLLRRLNWHPHDTKDGWGDQNFAGE